MLWGIVTQTNVDHAELLWEIASVFIDPCGCGVRESDGFGGTWGGQRGGKGQVIFDEKKPGSSLDFRMDDSWMTILEPVIMFCL
ncbi:hypothetical protein Tco_0841479 [Tanacetum coccineum]|uniref:Uncharacterized protein n=1 Tax=Tanacetum coccineum TaxID=301880 RepID=A0ABQ5AZZ5_9ASTR